MNSPYLSPNPRRDTLLPPLHSKRVMMVGLSGGAPIAVELAKSGVSQFDLFDFDTLDAANLIRHPCGVEYVGKNKAVAVAEFLERQSGGNVNCTTHNVDVFDDMTTVKQALSMSDLLIVATDNEASRFFLSELAVIHKKPALFVGMFEGATGGEIFAHRPGIGCYCCLAEHIGRKDFIKKYVAATNKKDCASERDTHAMPGLGVDQGLLCNIAARKSLDLLLEGQTHSLSPVGRDWIIFSICGIPGILEDTLATIQCDIPRHPACASCSWLAPPFKQGDFIVIEKLLIQNVPKALIEQFQLFFF